MASFPAPSALQTRVGRRVLAAFLLSAFLPACALAVLTWREVRHALVAQSQEELRDEAKRLALDIVGHLQHAAREARDVARRPDLQLSMAPDALIDEVAVLQTDGSDLVGAGRWDALSSSQRKLLDSGGAILLHRIDGAAPLWIGVPARGGSTLIAARIRDDRLLQTAVDESLPASTTAMVADQRNRTLHADAGLGWPAIPAETSGLLAWDGSERYVGAYFKPPLTALFGIPSWTVAVGKRQADVFAPIDGFLRQFVLVVAFTLGVVCLLSLVQVRRELVPLSQLRDSARRLAERNFEAPVEITSGDEFQELGDAFDQMRRALRQTFHTLESRAEIDRAVLSTLDTSRIATLVVESLVRVMASSGAACVITDDDGASTTVWHARGGAALTVVGRALDPAQFTTIREWTAAQAHDVPAQLHALLHEPASHLLAVPVHVEQRLAALLVLARADATPFDDHDRELVEQTGQQVAVALTNARLVQRLERLNLGTLNALARTIDAKSPWTAGHSERVTVYGVALAERLGLGADAIAEMRRGGLLHDIGKIAIPNHILDKAGPLTADEMAIVKRHPEVGARILEPIAEYANAIPIVLEHHERWDGGGYPGGLRGEAISLGGRIFALADVFDALTSDRPYRPGWSLDAVMALFARETGRHFDPQLAPLFIELMPQLASRSRHIDQPAPVRESA